MTPLAAIRSRRLYRWSVRLLSTLAVAASVLYSIAAHAQVPH